MPGQIGLLAAGAKGFFVRRRFAPFVRIWYAARINLQAPPVGEGFLKGENV